MESACRDGTAPLVFPPQTSTRGDGKDGSATAGDARGSVPPLPAARPEKLPGGLVHRTVLVLSASVTA